MGNSYYTPWDVCEPHRTAIFRLHTSAATHRLLQQAQQCGDLSRLSPPSTQIHTAAANPTAKKEDKSSQKRSAISPATSPFSKGPVSKKQLAADEDSNVSLIHTSPQAQFLATFPSSDQPASEFTIKEMLLSLKNDL